MQRITFSKDALRTLSRLPTNIAGLIRSKIEQYATDPSTQANNVKKLRGSEGAFRLRVGDWRVIFKEDGKAIAVTKVAPRGGVYNRRTGP